MSTGIEGWAQDGAASKVPPERLRPLMTQEALDEVDTRDELEVTNLDKAPPIALADLHVINDSTVDALRERSGRRYARPVLRRIENA